MITQTTQPFIINNETHIQCQKLIKNLSQERQEVIDLGAHFVAYFIEMAVLALYEFDPHRSHPIPLEKEPTDVRV